MKYFKLSLITVMISTIVLIIFLDLKDHIIIILNENISYIKNYQVSYPFRVEIIFFITYVFLTSLSIPIALILGLLSGMIFHNTTAILIVSFASAIGATLAFLISRYLFRDYLEKKYNKQYLKINSGIEKNSGYYIFALRMCVVFPFFMVNLLLGLTTIKPINYYLISQLGMLPATVIIVSLGDEISGALTSDISIDFTLVMLLAALGLLPLLSRLFFRKILN